MVEYRFQFEFDRAFVRRGFLPNHRWRCLYIVLYIAFVACAGAFLFDPWSSAFRDPSFLAILALSLVVLLFLRFLALGRGVQRTCELWSREAPDRILDYHLTADGLTLTMKNAEVRRKWSDFRRLWRYEGVWLLEIVKNHSLFYPVDSAPEGASEFLVERFREAGVRV